MHKPPPFSIATNRLELVQLKLGFLKLALQSPSESRRLVDFVVPDEWFAETSLMQMRVNQLEKDPNLTPWLLRAIVRRIDNKMIGHFNGHGRPGMPHLAKYSKTGMEIGYTIYPEYRRQGYAAEAIEGFTDAIAGEKPKVAVFLCIKTDNTASLDLAKKLGYTQIDELTEGSETELVFTKPLE